MAASTNLAVMIPFIFGKWICLASFGLIIALIAVLIATLASSSRRNAAPPSAFPVMLTGRGIYVIRGVYRTTKADALWRVEADSEANARIKADLEGIIVASVSFERSGQ